VGVGTSKAPGVRWGVARGTGIAWIVKIPATTLAGALSWIVLSTLGIG